MLFEWFCCQHEWGGWKPALRWLPKWDSWTSKGLVLYSTYICSNTPSLPFRTPEVGRQHALYGSHCATSYSFFSFFFLLIRRIDIHDGLITSSHVDGFTKVAKALRKVSVTTLMPRPDNDPTRWSSSNDTSWRHLSYVLGSGES